MSNTALTASVLELLHPLGHAEIVRVIGCGCREELSLCPRRVDRTSGSADLIVLAPSSVELSTPGWLEAAVRDAAGSLRRDGLLYVLSPRRGRRRMKALLRACGLTIASTLIHHPDWARAGTLVPLRPAPLAYAFSRLIRTDPFRRRVALGLVRIPGALALLRAMLPCVGFVVQGREARPQSNWFTDLLGGRAEASDIVVNTSWRGRDGATLLHAVDPTGGEATAVAKTWLAENGEAGVAREAAGLQEIAVRAGEFGVRVPELLGRGRLGHQPYVAETAVTGEKVAPLLVNRPHQVESLLTQLASWLLAWNSATLHLRVLTPELLDELLLGPAELLSSALGGGETYQRRLSDLARRLQGQRAPFVATHADLTMVNVLIDRDGRLGVIDWETARPSGLPLSDFFYAAVDAAAAVEDYRDRAAAFNACFAQNGPYHAVVRRLQERFVEQLGLRPEQVALSFHASWLQFALDERRESAKMAPDEFLHIARQAASGEYEYATGHRSVG